MYYLSTTKIESRAINVGIKLISTQIDITVV